MVTIMKGEIIHFGGSNGGPIVGSIWRRMDSLKQRRRAYDMKIVGFGTDADDVAVGLS